MLVVHSGHLRLNLLNFKMSCHHLLQMDEAHVNIYPPTPSLGKISFRTPLKFYSFSKIVIRLTKKNVVLCVQRDLETQKTN